jgi:competence protein ComEC
VRPDDRVQIGPVLLHVLHPPEPDWERQRVRNDDSIVIELRYGDVSIVLTGDIGAAIEESLIPRLSDAPLRILKASHHGSATSTADAWLTSARAVALVISCGRQNRYGHPAPVVLQRAVAHGVTLFRTDQDGAITLTTDGKTATVTTFAGQVSRFTTKGGMATKVTMETRR